ncbi:MAG: energy transducer TonB [Bacteroidota bacterium]
MRPIPASPPFLRWARFLLVALACSGSPAAPALASSPVRGNPDPAILGRCLERLARAAAVEVVTPGSKRLDTTGFRQIPHLFAMTTAPPPYWRDSLIVLLDSPGALRAGADSPAIRDDRQVWEVRVFASPESTELVVDLSAGTISIRSSGLRPIHTGCAAITDRLRALFQSLPKSAWGERALATWGPPVVQVPQVSAMDSESRSLPSRPDPPDTIWYRADIGADGRIESVFSRTFGLVDDAEERRARGWTFRPALLNGHPIRSRIDLGLPVARGRRPAGVDSTVWTLATARTGGPPVLIETDSLTLERLRIGGAPWDSVRLRVLVGIEGWVKDVQIIHSVPGSDRLAMDATRKSRYRPSIYHGGRTAAWVEVAVPVSRSRRQIWSPPATVPGAPSTGSR